MVGFHSLIPSLPSALSLSQTKKIGMSMMTSTMPDQSPALLLNRPVFMNLNLKVIGIVDLEMV